AAKQSPIRSSRIHLKHRSVRIYDGFAAERSLRQLLQGSAVPALGVKNMRQRFIVADLRFIK
ncbi:hypothetical protein PMI22_01095, partial [Pseudomonas sp. GM21]|uniref:hypothetical protein n=1 Tax=Pseudomonas sp. GM21 TaxID=1144325 RepID=UPI0002723539